MARWSDVPDGVTISMDKETAMGMGGGKLKSGLVGVFVGAVLVAGVMGPDDDAESKPKPTPTPSASSSRG